MKTIHETRYGELLGLVIVGVQATELVNAGVIGITAEATIETHRRLDRRAPDACRGGQGGGARRARTARFTCRRRARERRPRLGEPRVDASKYLIPTLKDDPADAEAISHRLLVRGGFVRQVGSGLYTYLPLGWRVLQKTMGIIREEMDTIGLEMLMPVLQPAELWRTTDRYDIDVLFKLEDSSGKPYALAITHEECVTWHAAREIRSYRELPQIWYHQQTKERDEPRPRGGILRTREFIMKDSYSFDRDLAGLEESTPSTARCTCGSTTAAASRRGWSRPTSA